MGILLNAMVVVFGPTVLSGGTPNKDLALVFLLEAVCIGCIVIASLCAMYILLPKMYFALAMRFPVIAKPYLHYKHRSLSNPNHIE